MKIMKTATEKRIAFRENLKSGHIMIAPGVGDALAPRSQRGRASRLLPWADIPSPRPVSDSRMSAFFPARKWQSS